MRMPSVFVSHGSPMTAIQDAPARRFLQDFGRQLPRPEAILILTAHFESRIPALTVDEKPAMIYDFGGFPKPLYEIVWSAPGSPDLAMRAGRMLQAEGVQAGIVRDRGYDHGTWVPLMLMYPEADIPVVQLSVLPEENSAAHIDLGRKLSALRDEGVLIIGSGSLTHNLRALNQLGRDLEAPVQPWVADFTDWIADKVEAGDTDAIAAYRETAPHAVENHPWDEHFLPLPFAMGAGAGKDGSAKGKRVHASYEYGVLAMDAYVFG
ncbi:MAG: class III extradiol ring-cleavage dioxygenase [Beijerinckiaceae bacterium]